MAACALGAAAQSPAETFAQSGAINPDKCAVLITDLGTGKIVDSHNADTPLIPASVTKTVTIASTLGKTGINHRYKTDVYLTGPIKDGTVEGNIYIMGSGDPTLGADVEPYPADFIGEITKALQKKGVREVAGTVRIDATAIDAPAVPPSWGSGDRAKDYGAPVYGFNWHRNASGSRSVQDPQAAFARDLTSRLARAGITVRRALMYPDEKLGKPLVTHVSPAIDDIMRSCMRRSDNMYAETLLRTFAFLNGKPSTPEAGGKEEMALWKKRGAHMEGVNIVDGSGLSRQNRLTARFLSDVLTQMASNVDYASFFPLAGQEGTLAKFLKDTPLDGYIAMKTGSMSGVQCYAGYMLDEAYAPTHVVVILINDFPKGRAEAKKAAQDMLLQTFTR